MTKIPKIGEIISVKSFAFDNKEGGTGLSNWRFNERFEGVARVKVTKIWHDYETGYRGWAEPDPKDTDLVSYLKRNAKRQIVYWSQWDAVFE